MTFPSSPTNGQVSTVGGITYTYNSTKTAWFRVPSTGSNISVFSTVITGATPSTSTTSGALQVTGGAGIQGAVVAGQLNSSGNVIGAAGTFNALTVNGNELVTGFINTTGNVIANTGSFYSATLSTDPSSTNASSSVPTTRWVRDFGGFQGMIVYTNATFAFANTSATLPVGIEKIKVTTVGGGGAGGGNPATVGVAGAGGGAGGICTSYFAVVSGAQYWANVGAGGVSVLNANGGTGNISTFTISGTLFHQASGGQGGNVGVASLNVVGGFGGTATGGNLNLTGSAGDAANYHSATAGQSSSGGGAPGYQGYGRGTSTRTAGAGNAPGAAGATGTGAGGSGSVGGAATATTGIGGNGGGGLIIIEY